MSVSVISVSTCSGYQIAEPAPNKDAEKARETEELGTKRLLGEVPIKAKGIMNLEDDDDDDDDEPEVSLKGHKLVYNHC